MAVSWGEIFQHLMGAGLIVSRGTKEKLEQHDDPIGLIANLSAKGVKGKLTPDMIPSNPGRVIAPIAAPQTEQISMRNNMPDWRREDFPMDAIDAMFNIEVHYDITGNSTTEGKIISNCIAVYISIFLHLSSYKMSRNNAYLKFLTSKTNKIEVTNIISA